MDWKWRLRRLERTLKARLSLLRPGSPALLSSHHPLLRLEYPGPAHSRTLLVFLPGIGDLADDFERHGFVDELRRLQPAVHAVAVDAHYGYYHSRALFERLTTDVLEAAEASGYQRVWLAGVSMGGFGAAAYAANHSSRVAGLLLLAPYPGEVQVLQEIRAAGGLLQWRGEAAGVQDISRHTWQWLREQAAGARQGTALWLGYGSGDRFASGGDLLRQALPGEQVVVLEGGHNWRTWRKLWRAMLEREPFGA